MAAGITHEIRNPMAVVRGFLQLMREKEPGGSPLLLSYCHGGAGPGQQHHQ
ncbi:histidine kinase dimerization/phospho-acceptor domain-containing protein [Paenibacillus rhizoplanae]